MSNPHYFKHEREDGENTLIVAVIAVIVALLIVGVLYASIGTHDGATVISTLSPLPPLIDSLPAHDAGQ